MARGMGRKDKYQLAQSSRLKAQRGNDLYFIAFSLQL
jgi:hypothetical protein